MSPTLKLNTSCSVWNQSQKSFLSYLICFLHITDFATCCWVESCKRLSLAGPDPFIVNEELWTWRCLGETWSVTQPLSPSPGRLPWCIWCLALGQAEEEARAGSPHWSRSLFFHSVPFWGEAGHPGSVLSSLSTLSTSSLLFYSNVEEPLLAQELDSLTPPHEQRLLSELPRFFKHLAEIKKRAIKISASVASLGVTNN